ncbi:23S rRNA pseudouridine1911/1915/1917 synthase [Salsuginibacillus halophilus]|uniref:RNA pseudouridylate synthase n=1 Tax=Salsuginibacillus halophilus TaxID=517424 RepID=A0A2P8HXD7_9BACI|nr:RluA family pseudouridine synthase [Salsuginibacillus halophilus]PSL50903.1 23S rRNA pseudouridine1911/1915/1917 synthase [Salsuginibacillus halophilus]
MPVICKWRISTEAELSVKFYLKKFEGVSARMLAALKQSGFIWVNGASANQGTILQSGDELAVRLPDEKQPVLRDVAIPSLTPVYEDDHLSVWIKPAGLLTLPGRDPEQPALYDSVVKHYASQGWPGAVHAAGRLDRGTSGLQLIAKHRLAKQRLERDGFQRTYQALVTGCLSPEANVIEQPLKPNPNSLIEQMTAPDGKYARTSYRTLKCGKQLTWIEALIATGRTHQIRVHLSHVNHPLINDALYGGPVITDNTPALHAAELVFKHPMTKNTFHFESPAPARFETLWDKVEQQHGST